MSIEERLEVAEDKLQRIANWCAAYPPYLADLCAAAVRRYGRWLPHQATLPLDARNPAFTGSVLLWTPTILLCYLLPKPSAMTRFRPRILNVLSSIPSHQTRTNTL
jgi:hypothetical protein